MIKKPFCTIMTPTYNRGHLLTQLYDSLVNQTDHDFEWIIVDDGSTDDTKKIIKEFINKTKAFKIKSYTQKNGGKHRAVNNGIDKAEGKVFAIVDSDDYLTNNAILTIKKGFQSIEEDASNSKFCGIGMLKGYSNSELVGKTFNEKYIDAKSTERRKNGIFGDKFEVFYTSILKNNKFPEIENEKFMTEAVLWNRIANLGYKIRWFNEIIYICEYLPNGLTDSREKLIETSPMGYALYIKELVKYCNITLKEKLGYYSFYTKIRKKSITYKQIAKELDTNITMIVLSVVLRRIKEFVS